MVHDGWRDACLALGLIDGDMMYDLILEESGHFQTVEVWRQLFVNLVAYEKISDPLALLLRHKTAFQDRSRWRLQTQFDIPDPSDLDIWNYSLSQLARAAAKLNKTLSDLRLPEPSTHFGGASSASPLQAEQQYIPYQQLEVCTHGMSVANSDQREAIESILNSVDNNLGHLFFLDGPGGTGKTFVERLCLAKVRSDGKIALAVASSGVAATLLPGGRTAHSRFSISVPKLNEDVKCTVPFQSQSAELFRHVDLIIWDEAVMQRKVCFVVVDEMLRDVRKCDKRFGGITMVFAGEYPTLAS